MVSQDASTLAFHLWKTLWGTLLVYRPCTPTPGPTRTGECTPICPPPSVVAMLEPTPLGVVIELLLFAIVVASMIVGIRRSVRP